MDCVIHCRRPAETGQLCNPHRARLADLLDPAQRGQTFTSPGQVRTPPSIPVLYSMLSARRGVHGLTTSGPPVFGSRSPADDAVITLRDPRSRAAINGPDDVERAGDAPLAVLLGLTVRVIAARGAPERRPALTVPALASWLHASLGWLAEQPWVGEVWAPLRAVSASLRAAVGDPAPGSVGRCWVLVDDAGTPDRDGPWRCATPLYMPELPPRAADEPITLPALRCGGCGHHYTGAELVQLGKLCEAAAS